MNTIYKHVGAYSNFFVQK